MIIYILLLILSLFYILRKRANGRYVMLAKKIPGPPTLPLFGNSLSISNYPGGVLKYFIEATKKYGPVTRYWMGPYLHVYITDPDDTEVVLKSTLNLRKSNIYNFYEPWVGNALLRSKGDHWRHHRKYLAPTFHLKNLKQFVKVFNDKGKILISKLEQHIDGEPFNIIPYIELYILDAVVETGMRHNINAQENNTHGFITALNRSLEITNTRIYNPLLHPDIIFRCTPIGREYFRLVDYLKNYCKKILESRKAYLHGVHVKDFLQRDSNDNTKTVSFLDLVLADQKLGNGFSDSDVLDEVNNFLFAGQDTGTGLIFTLYNLAKYPEVQEKVYNEIVELFGSDHGDLTLSDLQKVQYLEMVIKESLRLFPSAADITRELDTEVELKNYTIPAGTSLTCFSYMLMRNEEYFPDPDRFDPERFSIKNSKGRHPFAYTAFSAGPRNCIGQKYGMLKVKSTVIQILSHYKLIHVRDIEQMEDNIVLTPIGGVLVRLERR